MTDPKAVTFCTLVDGRQGVLQSEVEIILPHLISTAHAAHNIVFVDCLGPGGSQALRRVAALQPHLHFKFMCVNTSQEALNDWGKTWLEGWNERGSKVQR